MNDSSERIPVAVLGGGAFAAKLVHVIGKKSCLPALELRLHGQNHDRLQTVATHALDGLAAARSHHAIRFSTDADETLSGARLVVLLIRYGGLAARANDEAFPHEFGLVGDEGVGVGGLANAWRTLPQLENLAEKIGSLAKGATVLNMMAPLGVTTRLLLAHGLRAVGLCELPSMTLARWTHAAAPMKAEDVAYAGLNHLGFFFSDRQRAEHHPILRAAAACNEVPIELLWRFDAAPLHYFVDVFEPGAALKVGRRRRPGRAADLARLQRELLEKFRARPGTYVEALDRRATPWFECALVPALEAVVTGTCFRATFNVRNGGVLPEAPDDVVVELFGEFNGGRVRCDAVRRRPQPVREMIARLAMAEDWCYRGAAERRRDLIDKAIDALPLQLAKGADRAALLDRICEPSTDQRVGTA